MAANTVGISDGKGGIHTKPSVIDYLDVVYYITEF